MAPNKERALRSLPPFSVAVITRPRCKCPRCSPSLLAGLPKEKRRRPLPHAATDFINWSLANRRLQFHKRRQPFIRSHSEMLSAAAMRSCMRTSLASLAAKQDSRLQARRGLRRDPVAESFNSKQTVGVRNNERHEAGSEHEMR